MILILTEVISVANQFLLLSSWVTVHFIMCSEAVDWSYCCDSAERLPEASERSRSFTSHFKRVERWLGSRRTPEHRERAVEGLERFGERSAWWLDRYRHSFLIISTVSTDLNSSFKQANLKNYMTCWRHGSTLLLTARIKKISFEKCLFLVIPRKLANKYDWLNSLQNIVRTFLVFRANLGQWLKKSQWSLISTGDAGCLREALNTVNIFYDRKVGLSTFATV